MTARRLRLSEKARADVESIWLWSAQQFGTEHADRYLTLLVQALDDVRVEPERPPSRSRPELGPGLRSYHIDLSKARSGPGIKSPRHVIFYLAEPASDVLVVRILHDQMDPERHIVDK